MQRPRHHLLILTALVAGSGAPWARAQEEDPDPRAFQVYDTPAVAALVERAQEHIEAERWSEALVDLQSLLEDHRGEVLGATHPRAHPGRRRSVYAVHQGGAAWAARTLAALPTQARELYQERQSRVAARALAGALAAGDRAALASIAQRYPTTREARRAWWALGDLELERGDLEIGLAAWARAVMEELELDELDPRSPLAWRQALASAEEQQAAGDGAVRARLATALALLGGEAGLGGLEPAGSWGTALSPGSRVDLGPLRGRLDTWPRPFVLESSEEHPFRNSAGKYALFPARLGERLYVSTSRALLAVGAYTGEILWRTPPDMLGWERLRFERVGSFEEAIPFSHALIAPAVARGVVVAALQIPSAFEDKDTYGDLSIIKIVPERRLFAFDAANGKPLWNTLPPLFWDGESGSFAERMTIVGPPTISGSRVLVPAARLRGRVELHLGCFDLGTGELLWHSPIITGQRELNMFGRLVEEFTAPPAVVAGDRIVVQTQLGSVACLDLFTGDTLWHCLYDQIAITAGNYFVDGQLDSLWRNAPPVVAGETVVAAPFDSSVLLGIDLATGSVSWSLDYDRLNRIAGGRTPLTAAVDTLLGADERRVVLAGRRVAVLEAPGGLAREAPRRRAWVYPSGEDDLLRMGLPRPVVGRDRVYVPRRSELVVLERRNGKALDAVPWRVPGNLLVDEGGLFTLSAFSLAGYFRWEVMLRRARAALAKNPDDLRALNSLVRILHQQGLSAMSSGDLRRAEQHFEAAQRELAERFGEVTPETPALLRTSLHHLLCSEARNKRLASDPHGALERLAEARHLAPDRQALFETLLEEQAILRTRDPGAWLEVCGRLEEGFADLTLPVRNDAQGDGWPDGDEDNPWRGSLVPTTASLAEPGEGSVELTLPVGLWVLVERSQVLAARGAEGDGSAEFADLHSILARYPDVLLSDGLFFWDWAAARIAGKLARGEREGYEQFERAAVAELERARSRDDLALLERVPRLYPHSRAAGVSNEVRIELSVSAGDAQGVAEIVLGELPADYWHASEAGERHLRHLVRLAQVLGGQGNLELRAALTAFLARHHPELDVGLPGRIGTPLKDLAQAWRAPRPPAPPAPTFGPEISEVARVPSTAPFVPLGQVPHALGGEEPDHGGAVSLFCDGARLYAFSEEEGDDGSGRRWEPLWRHYFDPPGSNRLTGTPLPIDFEVAFATSPGRVHVATLARVVTFDRRNGEALWSFTTGGRGIYAVDSSQGVVITHENVTESQGERLIQLHGLDAATGIELWSLEFRVSRYYPRPVIGNGFMVLLPATQGEALVFDLFTGRAGHTIELSTVYRRTARAAWIEGGRIVLPSFVEGTRPARNHLVAYDLDSGERAWRVPLSGGPDGDRQLTGIFSHGEGHYLCLEPVVQGRGDRRRTGIYELNSDLGALATRPVAELSRDDEFMGIVATSQHSRLKSDYLFILSNPTRTQPRFVVRAIHLAYGERWRAPLPQGFVRTSDLPEPAVSDTTVALAYVMPSDDPDLRGRETELCLLDRATGRELGRRPLPNGSWRGTYASPALTPLGEALFVSGAKELEILR